MIYLPRLGPLIRLAVLILYRLYPVVVAGGRFYDALVWAGQFTNLSIARLLIAASCFGPAWVVSTLIFVSIWRSKFLFPDETEKKDAEGNIIPTAREVYETVYHPDGTRHTNCTCKKQSSDTHLLRCGHVVSHKILKEMLDPVKGCDRCLVCQEVAYYQEDIHAQYARAIAKLFVGLMGTSAAMLCMGISLDPNIALKLQRLLILLPIIRYLYASFKIREQAGMAWWRSLPKIAPRYIYLNLGFLCSMPTVAMVATWSVERLYEQDVVVPEAIFSGGRALTLAWGIVRKIMG